MAAISVVSKSRQGFRVQLTGLSSDYAGKTRTAEWYCGSKFQLSHTLENGITSSPIVRLENGLSRYTSYTIKCVVTYYDGTTAKTVTLTTTARTASTPAYFSWDNGEKVSGEAFDLTADEWNGLCENIKAVRKARCEDSVYLDIVSSGDTLTAALYNDVVDAITEMGYGDNLYYVGKGDYVYAYDLNILVDEINAVP